MVQLMSGKGLIHLLIDQGVGLPGMTGLMGWSSKGGDATGGDLFSVLNGEGGCTAIDEGIAGGVASETDGAKTGLKPKYI